MKEYVVLANLGTEAIALSAENETEAIKKTKLIIAENYGDSVANTSTYLIEEGN